MTDSCLDASGNPPSTDPRKKQRRGPANVASDDCFTCIKTNTKCDRRRPYCSQCLELSTKCSGYKMKLTWDLGVASRGKLRGLSVPTVGGNMQEGKEGQNPLPTSSDTQYHFINNFQGHFHVSQQLLSDNLNSSVGSLNVPSLPCPTPYSSYPSQTLPIDHFMMADSLGPPSYPVQYYDQPETACTLLFYNSSLDHLFYYSNSTPGMLFEEFSSRELIFVGNLYRPNEEWNAIRKTKRKAEGGIQRAYEWNEFSLPIPIHPSVCFRKRVQRQSKQGKESLGSARPACLFKFNLFTHLCVLTLELR